MKPSRSLIDTVPPDTEVTVPSRCGLGVGRATVPGAAGPLLGGVAPLVGAAAALVDLAGADADATAVMPPPSIATAAIPPMAASLRCRRGRDEPRPSVGLLFVMVSFRLPDESVPAGYPDSVP